MNTSQKRIFAGKQKLHAEPFCPFVSSDSGFSSLRRSFFGTYSGRPGNQPHFRPTTRGGKYYT